MVLGLLSIFLSALLALLALLQKQSLDQPIWLICLAYLGGGGLLLLVRALMGLPKLFRRQQVRTKAPAGNDGMVLVLVLVLLGLTSALLLHLQHAAQINQQTNLRLWQDARLRTALTDEGLHRIRELANDPVLAMDHLDEPWTRVIEIERPDGITTISRVTDLNRYLDFNNLVLGSDFTMANLTERFLIEGMTASGDFTPIERIEGLTDWIDADDEGIRESEFYGRQDPPYAVPNTWMHTWNEIRWIHGFSPAYFARKPRHVIGRPFGADAIDLLAIIPGPRNRPVPVNINTASSEVLNAVFGPEQEMLARYVYITRADNPFHSVEALVAQADPASYAELAPFLDVRSTHFLIEVQAFESGRQATLRAVAHREREGQVHILQWVL